MLSGSAKQSGAPKPVVPDHTTYAVGRFEIIEKLRMTEPYPGLSLYTRS